MPREKVGNSSDSHSNPGKRAEEQPAPQASITKRLLQSVWQKHRLLISLGAVLVLLLLTIIIQNPVTTTVDLLLWTVSMRQGVSLAFLFIIGWSCGWVTRSLYRRGLLGE